MHKALKSIRVFHQMSQKDLAEELKISAAHLCGIEKGKKQPTLEILTEYSRVFKLPLSSLLYFTEEAHTQSARRPISAKAIKMLEWLELATRS